MKWRHSLKHFLFISVALHALLAITLTKETIINHKSPSIDIEVIKSPIKASKKRLNDVASGSLPLPKTRINSDDNGHLPLDKALAADNYIERIRLHIEPEWRQKVNERIRILRRMGKSYACTACVDGHIEANGSVGKLLLTQACADSNLSQIALNALDKQLPPPPSSLLKDSQLILAWCFATR